MKILKSISKEILRIAVLGVFIIGINSVIAGENKKPDKTSSFKPGGLLTSADLNGMKVHWDNIVGTKSINYDTEVTHKPSITLPAPVEVGTYDYVKSCPKDTRRASNNPYSVKNITGVATATGCPFGYTVVDKTVGTWCTAGQGGSTSSLHKFGCYR